MTDLASPLLVQRTAAARQSFYVYQDRDSAFNHGFPSGFFGTTSKLTIDTAAIDDPTSLTGTTTDPSQLDLTRGTVMALTFAPESAGQFTGVNIEEPENSGVTQAGRGYDLRGATQVIFDVRSPTPGGITVQFGVGQRVTNFIHIPQSAAYTTMAIPLANLGIPNMADVHILFSCATNDVHSPNGGILLLDNIRFDPVPASQQLVLSFPLSTQTFGAVPLQLPDQGRVPFPSDQVLRNLTTTYESATTLLALLRPSASPNDLTQAREIADTFVYALAHDNHGDLIPTAPDGSTGLHNGYLGGDVSLFNSQQTPKVGQQGDIRLAGFSASTSITPSGFLLLLDGATGGNNAFAILALSAAYRQFQDPHYLAAAEQIGRWIVGNLTDHTGTGYGGYYLGYPDEGAAKTLQTGKSVENNADIFAALSMLAAAEQSLGNLNEANFWTSRANIAGDFVIAMYDFDNGRFNAGTVPAGVTGLGIDPTGPQKGVDVINKFDFLDSNSFTILALAGSSRYRNAIDWRLPVQYILNHFAQTVTAGGKTYQGFNIVTQPTSGPNGIAWEFTGQVVELTRFVDILYGETRFEAAADAYLAQIQLAQATAPFHSGGGLVASTVQGGGALPPIQQALSTPFQNIPERVGLAATTWAVFADQRINPLINLAVAGYVYLDTTGNGPPSNGVVKDPLSSQTVFLDLNHDGRLDPGDPVTNTNSNGYYTFNGLTPGNYTVRIVPYPGNIATYPAGGSQTVSASGGQLSLAGQLGMLPTSSLIPLTYKPAPFGSNNPDVQTAEVNGLYHLILNRDADVTGGAAAISFLKNGGPLSQLAANLLTSVEYDTNVVVADYQNYLRRTPDAAGKAAAVAFLQNGGTLNQLALSLLNSAEYSALFPSNATYVQAAFGDILGRLPASSDIVAAVSLLASGFTRAQFASFLVNSPESAIRGSGGLYGIILARAVDSVSQTAAVGALQSGSSLIQLADILFGSAEFIARAKATVR